MREYLCLYSAAVVKTGEREVLRLFEYSPHTLPGTARSEQWRMYTNTPRSGIAGLPRDWEMDVQRISVLSNKSGEELDAFLANTRLLFRIDGETVFRGTGLGCSEVSIKIPECTFFNIELITPVCFDKEMSPATPDVHPIIDRLYSRNDLIPGLRKECLLSLQQLKSDDLVLWCVLEGSLKVTII